MKKETALGPEEPSIPVRFPIGRFALIAFLAVGAFRLEQTWIPSKPKPAGSKLAPEINGPKPAQVKKALKPGRPGTPPLMTVTLEFNGVKSKTGYVGTDGYKKDWNPGIGRCVYGLPLAIKGKTYEKGIGAHSPSYIVFDLGGEIRRFTCLVGADAGGGASDSVQFVVKGDGRTLFKSPVLKAVDDAVPVDLDVSDVKELSLIVDPVNNNDWDWADWVEVNFSKD